MQANHRPNYSDLMLKRELSRVFSSVYFVNKLTKKKYNDSYFLNFDALIDYARHNNIDEKAYIRSIQKNLLTIPHTYLARPFYKKYELKRALTNVFNSVHFDNFHEKMALQDSYFMNFDSFIEYAEDNQIDAMEYIQGIRDTLLSIPGCHER